MIKCLALDLDGTLLEDGGTLSAYTKDVLQQAIKKGIHVVVASGRAFSTLPESVISIPGVEYAITSNGAAIYSVTTKTCLQVHKIAPEAVEHILDIVAAVEKKHHLECIAFEAFIDGKAYAEADYTINPGKYGASPAAYEYVKRTREPVMQITKFIRDHKTELDSIDVIVRDGTVKKLVWDALEKQENRVYMTSSVAQLIEISDHKAGKHTGLAFVLDRLHLPREMTAAFGNADNDADMLAYAGLGVAVKNASEDCKAKAHRIALSNNEDGVARVILELMEKP